MEDIKLNYDDICIIPKVATSIRSRKECNPYDENGMLPIFTAPMDTVIDEKNINTFINNRINPVIPRTVSLRNRESYFWYWRERWDKPVFVAFSLKEAQTMLLKDGPKVTGHINEDCRHFLCIDMANGHMQELIDTVKDIKLLYGNDVIIMTGNIANPETYKLYDWAGVDYCRAGIGGGDGCLTSSCVGCHMPYFSLIKEMYEIKKNINGKCKIIADGNIRGFRDIQKALIYADYVMIGSLFNKALESAAPTTYGKSYFSIRGFKIFRPFKTLLTYGKTVNPKDYEDAYKRIKNGTLTVWKKFYGMSTKIAQKNILENNGKAVDKLKTAEGIVKYQKAEYTLQGWTENETDFLCSAMSYTNSRNLEEYKKSEWVKINQIRFNK